MGAKGQAGLDAGLWVRCASPPADAASEPREVALTVSLNGRDFARPALRWRYFPLEGPDRVLSRYSGRSGYTNVSSVMLSRSNARTPLRGPATASPIVRS